MNRRKIALALLLALALPLAGVADATPPGDDTFYYAFEDAAEEAGEVSLAPESAEEAPAGEAAWTAEAILAHHIAAGEANDDAQALRLGVGESFDVDGAALLQGGEVAGYYSTCPEVAAVEPETGRATALSVGLAEIVAVSADGATASLAVEVLEAPQSLSLSEERLSLSPGQAGRVAAILPEGTASHIAFASSDPSVCEVDDEGALTAVQAGAATITATAFNGVSAACAVTVLDGGAPTQLSLGARSMKLGLGEKRALKPAVGEGEVAAFTYTSSNPEVAAVSAKGRITALAEGSAKITVRTHNGLKAKIRVRVVAAPTTIRLSDTKLVLNPGQAAALKAKLPRGSASRIKWRSSRKAVVAVDADGNLTALAPGTARISATTFNGFKATCRVTVLDGAAPTRLSLPRKKVKLGAKDTYAIVPELGAGEAAKFTFATSNRKVAAVSSRGVVTARGRGTAQITVRTHNGLEAVLTVKVYRAPTGLTLSDSRRTLILGETFRLKARLPGGSYSPITWTSDDPEVASVDAKGYVLALQAGTAIVTAETYNGVRASCAVTVLTEPPEEPETEEARQQRMLDRLREDDTLGLGGKRDAIVGVVDTLMRAGFEPAFAAGVAANVYAEGTYGLFESSKYVTYPEKRPRYFAYLDGGNYYSKQNGSYVLSAVYLSPEEYEVYDGPADKYLRFGDKNYYLDNFSKKYATEVDLYELEALLDTLYAGGWQGKFGLGVVQWTGWRTKKLVEFYRRHAGDSSDITAAQVIAAENEMILYELNGSYRFVYNAWRDSCGDDLETPDAAREAGALVCLKYEVPADKEIKAIQRGARAAAIFRVMLG